MIGPRIEVRNVAHRFESSGQVLQPLSFSIAPGEFVTLLGPSGCGKSTLLKLLADLLKVQSGTIAFEPPARGSFVFQDATLLPWRTARENVGLAFELEPKSTSNLSHSDCSASVARALERVGLDQSAGLYPKDLSGGMRMRVAIARALVSEPRYIFFDEPFAALDETTRYGLQNQLRKLRDEGGLTIVFVTHSLSEAVFLSDRVLVLSDRPARVVAEHKVLLARERNDDMRTSELFNSEVRALQALVRSPHA